MAGSVNKVILIGNLGQDPEVKALKSGVKVAKFSLATSESYTDRNTGEKITNTEWHNAVIYGKLAEVAEKYLKKGAKVYVEGKLKTRNWQDENNQTRYATEVVVDGMTMLGSKGGNNQPQQGQPQPQAEGVNEEDDSELPF